VESIKDWDKQTLERFKQSCRNVMRRSGLKRFEDDFIGYALLKRCEGRTAKISWLYIDYVREEFGSHRARRIAKNPIPLDSKFNHLLNPKEIKINNHPIEHPLKEDFMKYYASHLKESYREVFRLFYVEGYTLKEIGRMMNRTESNTHSILKKIHTLLKAIDY
jgi:RNA polymerase sigma factor (sigma-70 family)